MKENQSGHAARAGGGSQRVTKLVEQAIESTLPTNIDQYDRALFDYCRAIKAIPGLADAPAVSLRDYVRRWHRQAQSEDVDVDFDTTWSSFLQAWPAVRFAKGAKPMKTALEQACNITAMPAVAARYDSIKTRMLIVLCRELQRVWADLPFFLSARYAGWLVDLDHLAAWRRLKMFEADGVLEVVEPGTPGKNGKATKYFYRGGD